MATNDPALSKTLATALFKPSADKLTLGSAPGTLTYVKAPPHFKFTEEKDGTSELLFDGRKVLQRRRKAGRVKLTVVRIRK